MESQDSRTDPILNRRGFFAGADGRQLSARAKRCLRLVAGWRGDPAHVDLRYILLREMIKELRRDDRTEKQLAKQKAFEAADASNRAYCFFRDQ